MNFFLILCVIMEITKVYGQQQYPWYQHVNCQNSPNGFICYDTNGQPVVTPFNNQRSHYDNTIPSLPAPYPAPFPTWPSPLPTRPTPSPTRPTRPTLLTAPLATPLTAQLPTPLPTNHSVQYPQLDPSTDVSVARNDDSPDKLKICGDEEFKCTIVHQCFEKELSCDGVVHCIDGTDEQNCPCVSKIDKKKLCDTYVDCPGGDDEVGCNGCDRDSYSCYSDVQNECYTKIQKCDHISQCSNDEDEKDCLLLKPNKTSTVDPFVRSTEGILYRNLEGNWYPVCDNDVKNFALKVCERELGIPVSFDSITIRHVETTYGGSYLSQVTVDQPVSKVVDKCSKDSVESTNVFVYVECPDYCGCIIDSTSQERIAGGKDASAESNPWIVGLYLNGKFVCAGSIIATRWVITAAHCVYHEGIRITAHDYLQIRAGFIRQHSFSPYEQYARVFRVIINPEYNANNYKNDLALLELNERLFFNRWVKPICLQRRKVIRNGTDDNWLWKPEDGTICVTAGWGGLTDRGPYPVENLGELNVPIVPDCVEYNSRFTCTGYADGGRDACSGDSGGPLVCTDDMRTYIHYLAGITSIGYNPKKKTADKIFCGEPDSVTAYTKSSFYFDWINSTVHKFEDDALAIQPTLICPGTICRTSNRCAKKYDGNVDCLDGEDEVKKP
ncbi:serine protease nudel-like [Bradysia coprophila]|uniref:serine protease nudel-like n=1 Tax=Bradysia coprophila TaxID=38358 RepID=UPI00187DD1E9|nr:serine protease nudel-like [Bradysia coprophila]